MNVKHYDIAVCGGGIAGVAAALAAARRGMKTVLIEKTILPGGLATSGLVLVYLPLCNAKGTQMIYGIAEELFLAAAAFSAAAFSAAFLASSSFLIRAASSAFVSP